MLSQENLEKIGRLPKENSIMAKFLMDNKAENSEIAVEIERNMPFAMTYYNEEARTPYLFRRISSTSTIKSVYFNSSPGSSSSQESIGHELKALVLANPSKNINYNIMILGDSGLGKTSFINTFMYFKFNFLQKFEEATDVIPTTSEMIHKKAKRTEGSIEFNIDMIDTPGYGSYRNVQTWLKYITGYIFNKIVEYKLTHKRVDERVHCCLFFIDSVLKQADMVALKELQKYTAIIPVIGKADTCTVDEIKNYKKIIISQLKEAEIEYFQYGEYGPAANNGFQSFLGECPPFCVISAASRIISDSRCLYGRKYMWGTCDINNPFHSDFPLIKKYLIGKFYYLVKHITKDKTEILYQDWLEYKKKKEKAKREIICKNKVDKMVSVTKLISCMAIGIFSLIRR